MGHAGTCGNYGSAETRTGTGGRSKKGSIRTPKRGNSTQVDGTGLTSRGDIEPSSREGPAAHSGTVRVSLSHFEG